MVNIIFPNVSKVDSKDIENKWDILLNKLGERNFLDKSVLNLNILEEKFYGK